MPGGRGAGRLVSSLAKTGEIDRAEQMFDQFDGYADTSAAVRRVA
ncbi:MAG TPA: hypothetical protein VLP43_12025 [Solirubrobacteraceae bacterium]|nr:hypothetical protein [Solirubrobacteraceae bacterium]